MRWSACSWLVLFGVSTAVCAQDVTRVEFPTRPPLGIIKILEPDEPKRLTYKEERVTRSALPFVIPRGKVPFPIRGSIELPAMARLDVRVATDVNGDLSDKLIALKTIPPLQVVQLRCSGKINERGLEVIANNTRLVDLTADGGLIWCGKAGQECLNKLTNLRYLQFNLSRDEDQFGNSELIETLLKLRELRFLEMPGDGLMDADIQRLASHSRLETLRIENSKRPIGTIGLLGLAKMPNLRELHVCCDSKTTDQEVLEFVKSAKMERITICTEAVITCQRQFRKMRPDCDFCLRGLDD